MDQLTSGIKGVRDLYDQELSEAGAGYEAGNYITSGEMLKLIREWGKENIS